MRHGVGLAAALTAALAAAPARAEVTAEQAAALQGTLRGWVAGLLAPLVDMAAVPLAVTPAGEGYRLELVPGAGAIPGLTVTSAGGVTAVVRPLGGTRWAIEEYRLPQDFAATLDMGEPGTPPGRFGMHISEQKMSGEVDPAMGSPSRVAGTLGGISQTTEGPRGPHTTSMGRLAFEAVWTPVGGAVMDGISTSTIEGYATQQSMPGGEKPLVYTLARARTTITAAGVDMARIGAVMRTAAGLASDIKAEMAGTAPSSTGPTPEQRKALHALLDGVAGTFARVEGKQELTGLHFAMGEMSGDLARAELGSALGAPDGNAELRLRIAAEGLESPMIPPGAIRQLLPRRFAIAPRVSGVPKATLVEFLSHAIDMIGDPDAELADEAMQLLADNPVTVGIDELLVELGVAKLVGSGQVQVASVADVTGAAELRMTGLDQLIRLIGQLPETKAATPFAVILKGIGKVEGSETVWRVAYKDGNATVNGTDLSALMGGAGGKRR